MVRPRKIPKDFVPRELSSDSSDEDEQIPHNSETIAQVHNEDQNSDTYEEPNYDNETDSDVDEEEPIPTINTFQTILEELSKEWLLIEMGHNVSKRASDLFWDVAKRLFHELVENMTSTNCKIPSFTHLRRRLCTKYCPEIAIKVAYKHRETEEITVKDVSQIPVSEFRKPLYEPLFEIASVKVIIHYFFIFRENSVNLP